MDLNEFFKEHNKVALAFSGGVDSSYLLYAAIKSGAQVRAYYVNAAFQPQFELDDATRLAKQLNADMKVLTADVLSNETVVQNPADRCYHCKNVIFNMILAEAKKDGFTVLMDGTNASDAEGDRPGMRALRELCVYSPLRICGLTKAEIRRRSKEAGLFTWDKPAYACLATRIPTNERITADLDALPFSVLSWFYRFSCALLKWFGKDSDAGSADASTLRKERRDPCRTKKILQGCVA